MNEITEDYLEATLRAIRSLPIEAGRELLRTFAVNARQGGMVDLVTALQTKADLFPKNKGADETFIHHLDGDMNNNSPENLVIVDPNKSA